MSNIEFSLSGLGDRETAVRIASKGLDESRWAVERAYDNGYRIVTSRAVFSNMVAAAALEGALDADELSAFRTDDLTETRGSRYVRSGDLEADLLDVVPVESDLERRVAELERRAGIRR